MIARCVRRPILTFSFLLCALSALLGPLDVGAQAAQLDEWKQQLVEEVQSRRKFTANIIDQLFSYGELGFQEFETSRYLVGILRDNGFTVEEARSPFLWSGQSRRRFVQTVRKDPRKSRIANATQ